MKQRMKIACVFFVIIFIFSSLAFSAPKITYNAIIDQDSDQIHVKVKLEDIDSKSSQLIFNLPDLPHYSKDAEQFNFYDFMSGLKAYSGGRDLDVTYKVKNNIDFIAVDYIQDVTYFEYSIDKQIYNIDPFLSDQLIPVTYFTYDYGYFWSAFLFLAPDRLEEPSSLHITFDTPENWTIMAPFKKINGYYAVEESEVISLYRHLKDSAFYMGETDFVAEKTVNNTTHKIARLRADEDEWGITTYEGAEKYINKVTKIYNYFVDLFGHNPYPVDLWRAEIKEFKDGTQISPGFGFMGNGWHYWPDDREFEITCHVVQSFMSGASGRPLLTDTGITKGFGEYYLGYLSSYELFRKDNDLAKMYYTYLVYDRIHDEQVKNHFEYDFMKGYALGIYLDNKIQEVSDGEYTIKDVLRYVYDKYHLTEHMVNYSDIQEAVQELTGDDMDSIFTDYFYGDKKIPAYQYISGYKNHFNQISDTLDNTFGTNLNGFVTPLFINIEMTLQNDQHIMSGLVFPNFMNQFADYIKENYQIANLTESDVETALSELTGNDCSGFFTHWEDTYGTLSLNDLQSWLKKH